MSPAVLEVSPMSLSLENKGPLLTAEAASIAFVIPAHNESLTVGPVVTVCRDAAHVLGASVLVVADHCVDNTASTALKSGAKVIHREGGVPSKYAAMLAGVERASTSHIFFVDADCVGLTATHLVRIARQVLDGRAVMAVGTFDYGPVRNYFVRRVPWSTGQRVMARTMFPLCDERASGYNVELLINERVGASGGTTASVLMSGVAQRTKRVKRGLADGARANLDMWREIASVLPLVDRQSYKTYCRRVELVSERGGRRRTRMGSVILGFYGMLAIGAVLKR